MVKKPGYPAASRRVSFTFNEDDDVRLLSRDLRTKGHERWIEFFFSSRKCDFRT